MPSGPRLDPERHQHPGLDQDGRRDDPPHAGSRAGSQGRPLHLAAAQLLNDRPRSSGWHRTSRSLQHGWKPNRQSGSASLDPELDMQEAADAPREDSFLRLPARGTVRTVGAAPVPAA